MCVWAYLADPWSVASTTAFHPADEDLSAVAPVLAMAFILRA
jgi:hypothetical protein